MANTPVNALVRVSTNNELDFCEWLDYHIALGFDRIYAYDSANNGWLPEVCRKRSEHVTLVPMANNDWRKKSNIIKAYVAQVVEPSWAICLEDDEFIWMDLSYERSISDFVNKRLTGRTLAMSVYVKYLSSEHPMKNRVGTMIDCFQHARPNPQGFVHPNQHTPNFSFTFFFVPDSKCVPMKGPLTPNVRQWVDSKGGLVTEAGLGQYLSSQTYNPDVYPVRGYKYALRSGMEMGMAPGTKPTGYTVRDNHMLDARAALLHIPVNEATEELYAKDELLVEQPKLPKREIPADEAAELELPVPLGKIDTFILYGYPLEHVIEFAAKNGYEDTVEHRAVIERVYRRECSMIIESTPVYRRLAQMDKEGGYTDDMVCSELKISYPALLKMRKCMSVLNIETHEQNKVSAEEEEKANDAKQAKAVVESSDIADLTKSFDDTVNAHPISKDDEIRLEKMAEEQKNKRRQQKAKAKKAKKDAVAKKPDDMVAAEEPKESVAETSTEPPSEATSTDDVEIDLGGSDLLASTDLSAFGSVDA